MARPTMGIALAVAVVTVALAWRSVAWPLVLAGAPTILVGLIGRNPFPNGAIAMSLFGWTLLALAFAGARGNAALSFRALLNLPVVATVVLAVLLIVRLGGSPAYAYGSVKAQLFVAENLFGLIAGMAIARYARSFRLFATGLVAVAVVTAVVLAHGLASGQLQAAVGGRFSIDQEASPIGLGRAAAQGIMLAVFLVLAAGPPLVRLFALGAMPLIAVSFIASGSRGPTIGLIIGIVVLLALALRDRGSRLRVALVGVAGVAGGVLVTQLVPGQDVQRSLSVLTGSGNGLSTNGRDLLWHNAWLLFRQHPLAGVGTGGFASVAPIDLFPHNIVLELGAEIGIVGVVAFFLVVAGGIYSLWRADRVAVGALTTEVAIVGALLAAAVVNAQVSSAVMENAAIWVAVGLALGLEQRATAMAGGRERRSVARALLPRRAERVRDRPALRRTEPPRRWQPAPVDRSPGEIVVPRDGAVVGGVVAVAGRAARTGWGVRAIELEVSRDGQEWRRAAVVALSEAAVVLRVTGGFREEVAVVRSDAVAHVLAAELAELDGLEYVVDRAARRPWATDSWSADWDTTSLGDGPYELRVVTIDMTGTRTVSPARRLTVTRKEAHEDLLDRRRGLDDLWERLTAREAELAAREALVVSREQRLVELEERERAAAARDRDLETRIAAHEASAAELEQRERAVERMSAANAKAAGETIEERRRLAAQAARAEQLHAELAEREGALQEREAAYRARNAELAEQAQETAARLADVERAEAALAAATTDLQRREKDVAELAAERDRIRAAAAELAQREAVVAARERAAAAVTARAQQLDAEVADLERRRVEHAAAAEALAAREARAADLEPRLADVERREAAHAEAAAELERRQQLVVQRETATASAAAEVARREREVAERRSELERALAEHEAAAAALAERDDVVTRREAAIKELEPLLVDLDRRSETQAAAEAELERRQQLVVQRETATAAAAAELARREREVAERQSELERALAEHAAAAALLAERDDAVALREATVAGLEPRLAELERREREHATAAAELDRRQELVVQRETATASAAAEIARREREERERREEVEALAAAQAAAAEDLARREADVAALRADLETARAQHAAAAAELARRQRDAESYWGELEAMREGYTQLGRQLRERERALGSATPPPVADVRPAEPLPQPPPAPVVEPLPVEPPPAAVVPPPAPAPAGAAAVGAAISLWVLESRVAAAPHPDAATQAEREATLWALRDYADAGGRIPPQFEQMVRDVFGELV